MTQIPAQLRLLLFAMVLLVLPGCTNEAREGDVVTYTFAWWVPVSMVVGCVIVFLVGVFLLVHSRYGWVLILGSPLFGIFLVPALFSDRVTITPNHFDLQTGIWFSPSSHHLEFANVQQIELISQVNNGRRKTTSYFMLCTLKSGGQEKVPLGDLMRNGPTEEIVRVAHARGIPILDRR